jgi:septal ring factor EnvC (AmiA/AmiB activator)
MLNSPLEIDMKPNQAEVYRVAFDSANSELKDILVSFEELRARKERIEKVVMALKPLLGAEEAAAAAAAMQSASDAANEATQSEEVPTYQYQGTNGSASSDPFARRLDSALGHGMGRKANRQF